MCIKNACQILGSPQPCVSQIKPSSQQCQSDHVNLSVSCKTSPQETQEAHEAAARELDSVIELLTQLSPGSCRASPLPTLTVTSTPTQTPSPHRALRRTPAQEELLLSPASTLDSRCSSRTKSSGRSSSCMSKGGLWVSLCACVLFFLLVLFLLLFAICSRHSCSSFLPLLFSCFFLHYLYCYRSYTLIIIVIITIIIARISRVRCSAHLCCCESCTTARRC